jgi:hypothetical protein
LRELPGEIPALLEQLGGKNAAEEQSIRRESAEQ